MRAFSSFGPKLAEPHAAFSSGCGARGDDFGDLQTGETGGRDFFGKGEDDCHDRPWDTTDGHGCGARDDVPEADNCDKDTADETRTEDQPADDTPPCDLPEEDPSAASKDDICEEDNTPSGDLPVCALPGDARPEAPHANGIIAETPDLDDDAEQDGQDSIAGLPLIDLPEEATDEAEDTLDWADMADALI
ncbi:hypothetical protein [Sagittula salina]|nr:hypothetical protein [Sagittula salina]